MGKSLNDMTYKGPDLTNSLARIILRFRADRLAVMPDIESMFYLVIVPDCDFLSTVSMVGRRRSGA